MIAVISDHAGLQKMRTHLYRCAKWNREGSRIALIAIVGVNVGNNEPIDNEI
jgi:hypothetical protein